MANYKDESALRGKLIRLAHENPDLRKDLLPMITASAKTAGSISWDGGRAKWEGAEPVDMVYALQDMAAEIGFKLKTPSREQFAAKKALMLWANSLK